MRAITTKVRPATHRLGTRVTAVMDGPGGPVRRVQGWNFAHDAGDNHEAAAAFLAAREGLVLLGGAPAPGGRGWVFLATEGLE